MDTNTRSCKRSIKPFKQVFIVNIDTKFTSFNETRISF